MAAGRCPWAAAERIRARSTRRDRFGPGVGELFEGGLLLGVDFEDLVEPGNPEDFKEVGVDAAELELALDVADLLLEIDQLAQRGAGEVLDVAEVE